MIYSARDDGRNRGLSSLLGSGPWSAGATPRERIIVTDADKVSMRLHGLTMHLQSIRLMVTGAGDLLEDTFDGLRFRRQRAVS